MTGIDLALMGIKNLLRRKARTILTVLGVIIGTASIVVMVSLGIGMNQAFEEQLKQYGSLTLIDVYSNDGGMGKNGGGGGNKVYLDDDAVKQFESLPNVKFAIGFKNFSARVFSGRFESYVSFKGVDMEKFKKMNIALSEGEMPTGASRYEVVAGFYAKESFYDPRARNSYMNSPKIDLMKDRIEMFPSSQLPEGSRPKGTHLNITGVTGEKDYNYANSFFMDYEEFLKLKKDFERRYKIKSEDANRDRTKKTNKYDEMKVSVSEVRHVQEVQKAIKDMGFNAYSLNDALEMQKQASSLMQAILGGIGAVSLFVAAIGITNTMVMSIYERTKEIGVMKVIGAQIKDIKRLFLFEAGMIGFVGGIFGLALSFAVSLIINSILGGGGESYGPPLQSAIPAWLALASLLFSTIVGLVAGYYPAVRATRLSALEAIRTDG